MSLWDFLSGTTWQPVNGLYGVLPLLCGVALHRRRSRRVVAIPLGLGSAIYLSEYAPEGVRRTVKPILELLAGMPTIVLGFFALDSIIPVLQDLGIVKEIQLFSALGAGIVVGILITPLISSLSEDAMRAVPERDARGRLRAWAPPSASSRPGSCSRPRSRASPPAIVLGLSRAVGETMAVTLAAGTQPNLTCDPTAPMQTITAYIVQVSQGEATRGSVQYESIFAVGHPAVRGHADHQPRSRCASCGASAPSTSRPAPMATETPPITAGDAASRGRSRASDSGRPTPSSSAGCSRPC